MSVEYLDTINERPATTDFVLVAPLDLPENGIGAEVTLKLFKEKAQPIQ